VNPFIAYQQNIHKGQSELERLTGWRRFKLSLYHGIKSAS